MNHLKEAGIAIIVHGGAWAIPDHLLKSSQEGVEEATTIGWRVLTKKGTAIDAVEQAIRVMEKNPVFDAGYGSALNEEGEVELDAIIMDGKTLNAGAVASVRNIQHPITLAKMIMEKTEHVMLVCDGALKFAQEMGIKELSPKELVTQQAVDEWVKYQQFKKTVDSLYRRETVGAVAIDHRGNIAAGTSTGGITAKKIGRVGDSPIIGSGAYADNNLGGVSATGHGEAIMKVTLSRQVLYYLERGLAIQEATRKGLEYMKKRVNGFGGVIAIDYKGNIGYHFTTKHMAWAYISTREKSSGV
ncbi:MAG: peptidase T [Candidatus Heimdallarchaeota archaeon]|nr:peptidase T [Candidatus Heimdallarchaeota archaeon]